MILSCIITQNGSGELDIFLLLFPILCCITSLMASRRNSNVQMSRSNIETDIWYTIQNIEDAYDAIGSEVAIWQKEVENKKEANFLQETVGKIFGRKNEDKTRFMIEETQQPRYYKIVDELAGSNYFELIKVEGGGTVVKVSYNPLIRHRIIKFKAKSPLIIPAVPIGNQCPSCGKPVLREFIICPYCGQKLITENNI